MDDGNIDRILESMSKVLPLFHRKLLRMDLGGADRDLTRLHFMVMGVLSEKSTTVSEIARIASISRPQVTSLIDKLVRLGAVERHPDENDRRVINIVLTEYGRNLLEKTSRKIKQGIKEKLSRLTPEELADMSAALETLKKIGENI